MSPAPSAALGRRRPFLLLWIIGGILVFAFLLALIVAIFGRVTGVEFSPDTFESREFRYFEIPILGVQVYPIRRTSSSDTFCKYLIDSKFITPQNADDPRWDLVSVRRTDLVETDAALLNTYLKDGWDYWKEWSTANPEMAKVLWPEVARLARQRMYLLVPDLMACAQASADATELRQRIDQRIADRYLAIAVAQHQQGKPELAVPMLAEALRYQPAREDLKRARAEAMQAAGITDEPPSAIPAEAPISDGPISDGPISDGAVQPNS